MTCSALEGEGIADAWALVLEHRAQMEEGGWLARRRREQALDWMRDALLGGVEDAVRNDAAVSSRFSALRQDVLDGRLSPFRAARDLLDLFRGRS